DHDGLAWVSPKSGRAVSINAGKKWESKLLILPKFLTNNDQNKITKKDIINGLNLTEYFLKKRIYSDINKNLPQTRKKLIDFLNK
ncbi:MAG: DNA repair protein RecO, partial [Pseudomonadota bacterium]|nr:DNA repair protein RecO [Pseudomonadota bacterium]